MRNPNAVPARRAGLHNNNLPMLQILSRTAQLGDFYSLCGRNQKAIAKQPFAKLENLLIQRFHKNVRSLFVAQFW